MTPAVTAAKRAAMAEPAAAERATGYVRGGISPLGQRSRLPFAIDESALGFERIHVSAAVPEWSNGANFVHHVATASMAG